MADMILTAALGLTAFMIIRSRLRRIGKGCCSGGCVGCSGCPEEYTIARGRKKRKI